MSSLTQSREVVVSFAAPFLLPGLERPYAAGSYVVRTDYEQLDVTFAATRRVATVIMLVEGGMTRAFTVDAGDLEAAIHLDREQQFSTGVATSSLASSERL